MSQTAPDRLVPRRLGVMAALALIGVGVSTYLTQHFYEIRNGTAGFKSLCNVSHAMNCDAVAASKYAELLPGLPLSSLGAGGFLALFIVAIFARNVFWRRESLRVAMALSTAAVAFSAAYLAVMAGVLRTFCLFCLVTDALSLGIFAIVLSLKPEGFSTHKPDLSKLKTLGISAAVAVAVSLIALKGLDNAREGSGNVTEIVQAVLAQPQLSVNSGAEFASIGPANAPVTIVEFSDFQCPFCRMGALTLNSVVQRYPTQVRVVFRNYPLDSGCNRKFERPMHIYACEAAKVARCAHEQGKFEPVYETLFENQASFAPGRILELAGGAGVDMDRLKGCVGASETTVAVSRDVEEGINLGVASTPTFFVNGRKVEGVISLPAWSGVIDQLLKR